MAEKSAGHNAGQHEGKGTERSNSTEVNAGSRTNSQPSTTSTSTSLLSTTRSSSHANLANHPINNPRLTMTQLINTLKTVPTLQVNITSSQVLDTQAQQLLAKVNPNLAQQIKQQGLSNNSPTTHTSASHQPLLKATAPSNNNTLYLVKLTHQQQTLTTVTPTKFTEGDKVQLQLNTQQQIIIKPSITTARSAIINSLKQALPQQQTTSQLLNTINTLQQLPKPIQELLLSQNTATQIKSLSHFIANNQTGTTSQGIKSHIQNSGIFLEKKLQLQQPIQGDLRNTLAKIQNLLQTEITLLKAGQSNTGKINNDHSISSKALDGALAQLLQTVSALPLLSSTQTNNALTTNQLSSFLQLFGLKLSHHSSNDKQQLKKVINEQLQKMVNNTQEKIHLNQLRTFSSEATANDTVIRSPTLHTEVPLRWGDQVLPLQISIQEHTEEQKNQQEKNKENPQDDDENKELSKRWRVFLIFDLPNDNLPALTSQENNQQLHAQLTIIENSVSATVWSESAAVCAKAKQHLHTLRQRFIANGLSVKELDCINGKPPSQEVSLDYNLVDIVT